MLSKELLLKAIFNRKNGVIDFSSIILNQAVDLILLENLDINTVISMTDEEIDSFYNEEDDECCDYGIECKCECGKAFTMEYDGERYEGYVGGCSCGKSYVVSAYMLDDYAEYCENNNLTFDEEVYIRENIQLVNN